MTRGGILRSIKGAGLLFPILFFFPHFCLSFDVLLTVHVSLPSIQTEVHTHACILLYHSFLGPYLCLSASSVLLVEHRATDVRSGSHL